MIPSTLLMMSFWTGIYFLCLVAYNVEAKNRKRVKLPDLLLRDFINIPEESFPGSFSGNKDDTEIVPEEDFDMDEIEDILQKKYGLDSTTTSERSSAFMLEAYRKLQEGESLSRATGHRGVDVAILQADTIRSFKPKDSRKHQDKIELTFSLDGITEEEITKRAELRLRSLRHRNRRVFKVKVSVLEGGDVTKRLSYRVKSNKAAKDGSALIDLTAVVQDIMDAGHVDATLNFVIRPRDGYRRSSSDDDVTKHDATSDRKKRSAVDRNEDDILVVYTKDKKFFSKFSASLRQEAAKIRTEDFSSRVKRGAKKERRHKIKGNCQKVDFTVDFETIGWDKWIIYPASFNAYRCGGQCKLPLAQSNNPTNHAVLQSLMRKRDRDSAPWPCCVPTKLRPISMLYYEHDEMVVRRHEDMVVDQCGCR